MDVRQAATSSPSSRPPHYDPNLFVRGISVKPITAGSCRTTTTARWPTKIRAGHLPAGFDLQDRHRAGGARRPAWFRAGRDHLLPGLSRNSVSAASIAGNARGHGHGSNLARQPDAGKLRRLLLRACAQRVGIDRISEMARKSGASVWRHDLPMSAVASRADRAHQGLEAARTLWRGLARSATVVNACYRSGLRSQPHRLHLAVMTARLATGEARFAPRLVKSPSTRLETPPDSERRTAGNQPESTLRQVRQGDVSRSPTTRRGTAYRSRLHRRKR